MADWNSSLNTFSTAGKGEPVLNGYKEVTLLDHKGKGCLTHMWFGGEWPGYEKTRLRVYVDGEATPSIDMELGMGHGVGFADQEAPWGSSRMGKTGNDGGLYNTYRIPYGTRVRVTAQRDKASPDGAPFWWIVRGTDGLRVVLGDVRLPERARLKLYTHADVTAQPLEELTMCDVKGAGRPLRSRHRRARADGHRRLARPELHGGLHPRLLQRQRHPRTAVVGL